MLLKQFKISPLRKVGGCFRALKMQLCRKHQYPQSLVVFCRINGTEANCCFFNNGVLSILVVNSLPYFRLPKCKKDGHFGRPFYI